MIRGRIEFTGETDGDVEAAVAAALSSIRQGFTSGFDRNETGSYHFELNEEINRMAETDTETATETILVAGANYWGQGDTLAKAKRAFQSQGGELSEGYEIVTFGPGSKFLGVDMMGRYSWEGPAPTTTSVPPRAKK